MVKFFKCEKCQWHTCCSSKHVKDEMKCGAVVQYLTADNPEAGENELIKSIGLKPIGCGGKLVEITEEEATSYDKTD